jgi:molecular chaperone DnaK
MAKEALSRLTAAKIICSHDGESLTVEMTEKQFVELTVGLVEQCRALCNKVLEQAKMTWKDINTILLVGGATRMPMILDLVRQMSGKEPPQLVQPDECVALGAAWRGAILKGAKGLPPVKVQKVSSHNLGVEALREADEKLRNFLMIPRFTAVPVETKDTFYTIYENQRSVVIRVLEGGEMEWDRTCDPSNCKEIGKGQITDIPPSPKGSPIEITYKYNDSGILEVYAVHMPSGRNVTVTLTHTGGLTDAELDAAKAYMKKAAVSG